MAKLKIGESPRRVEDARFITGSGCYIDDLRPAGTVSYTHLTLPTTAYV